MRRRLAQAQFEREQRAAVYIQAHIKGRQRRLRGLPLVRAGFVEQLLKTIGQSSTSTKEEEGSESWRQLMSEGGVRKSAMTLFRVVELSRSHPRMSQVDLHVDAERAAAEELEAIQRSAGQAKAKENAKAAGRAAKAAHAKLLIEQDFRMAAQRQRMQVCTWLKLRFRLSL